VSNRRDRLARARLYLVCERRPEAFLHAVLGAGVDLVQLRDKDADDAAMLAAAPVFRRVADEHGALFVLNDRPDLALAAGADGVHVGQEDASVEEARATVGTDRIVGLSTHSPAQIEAARAAPGPDYIAVGPVYATPTKPGRPAVGLELVRYATRHAADPWFAIGGIDPATLGDVVAAGARRAVVVRAITEADDPAAATRALREALDAMPLAAEEEAHVGTP
jgi:thiamine-phosphate pyrophosphorylase